MPTAYVDPTKLTDATGGTAGEKANPIRPAQIAAFAANDTTFRFIPRAMGVGGFEQTDYTQGSKVELGTLLTSGFDGLIFETDPAEEGLAILTPSLGIPAGSWSLVPTSSNVYQRIITDAEAAAIATTRADYYAQVNALTAGEEEWSLRRTLNKVTIAGETDGDKAAIAAGTWGVIGHASIPGASWHVVHAPGGLNLATAASNYIMICNARPTPGTGHASAAISLLECSNVTIRNLVIDGFLAANAGDGLSIVNSGDTFGNDPEALVIDNVRITDCGRSCLNIQCNSDAADASLTADNLQCGGIAGQSSDGAGVVRVVKFTAAPAGFSINFNNPRIGAHYILNPAGGEGLAPSTKFETYALKIGDAADGGVSDGTLIDSAIIRGVEGASAKIVCDVNWGSRPAPADRFTPSAYKTLWRDCNITGLSQSFCDVSQAFQRSRLFLDSSDARATATGSMDIGTGRTLLLFASQMHVSESVSNPHSIGISAGSDIYGVMAEVVNTDASPQGVLFGDPTGLGSQGVFMRASICRAVNAGSTLLELTDETLEFTDCVFHNLGDTAFAVGDNIGTLNIAGFSALSEATGERFDLDLSDDYSDDEAYPIVDGDVFTERHARIPSLVGSLGIDGNSYSGAYGAYQFASQSGGSRDFGSRIIPRVG